MEQLKLPLVSFIVTSFNYEKYVIKTLESIKNQTYKNIEIIVVDDDSNDNSVKKISEYIIANKGLNIKLIRKSRTEGQFAAILAGLEVAKGQFVSFIDSDDILIPDYTRTLIRVHMATSVAFASSQLVEIGENDEIHTTYSLSSFQKSKHYRLKNLDELLNVDVENVQFTTINIAKAPFGGWYWSAMSANMFRTQTVKMLLKYENTDNWRICPDKFILNFAHLIGGSALVYAPLVGYRRHSSNAGNTSPVLGNYKYNNNNSTKRNINNNIKVRFDMLIFLTKNKEFFIEKLGIRGLIRLYLSI